MSALLQYQPPKAPRGELEMTLYPEWANDEPVVCHYEYIRGEPMTRHHPGGPEEFNLISAYIRGWDCYRMLSDKQIAEMEQQIHELAYELLD